MRVDPSPQALKSPGPHDSRLTLRIPSGSVAPSRFLLAYLAEGLGHENPAVMPLALNDPPTTRMIESGADRGRLSGVEQHNGNLSPTIGNHNGFSPLRIRQPRLTDSSLSDVLHVTGPPVVLSS